MPDQLPPDLRLTEFHPGDNLHWEVGQEQSMAYDAVWNQVSGIAAHLSGERIGYIAWFHPGADVLGHDRGNEVATIRVHHDHRRHNIATTLWDSAKTINPELRHSTAQTDDGCEWANYERSRTTFTR